MRGNEQSRWYDSQPRPVRESDVREHDGSVTPSVLCPFPPKISPHVDGVHRCALHWATRHRLLDRPGAKAAFAGAKFANLMARVHPDASLPNLCLATAWVTANFALDDLLEKALVEQPRRMRGAVDNLVTWLSTSDAAGGLADAGPVLRQALGRPLSAALADVWQRTAPRMSPAWRERFVRHIHEYLTGAIWEAGNRAKSRPPDVEEYRRMRYHSAATEMMFDLIEPMQGVELPVQLFADEDFRALRRSAGMIIGIFNDLVSWPKEAAIGDHHNIVFALQRERALRLPAAVRAAVAEHDSQVIAFLAAWKRLDAGVYGDDETVAVAVADLKHWIRGNVDWSFESGRYPTPADSARLPIQRLAGD